MRTAFNAKAAKVSQKPQKIHLMEWISVLRLLRWFRGFALKAGCGRPKRRGCGRLFP